MGKDATLLIDAGNTNLKWSWLDGGVISAPGAASHRFSDVGAIAQRHWGDRDPPARVLAANVAGPEIEGALEAWVYRAWRLVPEFVRSVREGCGVTNAYDDPAQLGVDRWLTLVAVRRRGAGAACIVDSGTATTVDVIDGRGVHLGGLILPGADLMRDALLGGTRIPRVEAVGETGFWGTGTAEAVASAARQATAGLVERAMVRATRDLRERPRLILTGGGAEELAALLEQPHEILSGLVMDGLRVLAMEAEK